MAIEEGMGIVGRLASGQQRGVRPVVRDASQGEVTMLSRTESVNPDLAEVFDERGTVVLEHGFGLPARRPMVESLLAEASAVTVYAPAQWPGLVLPPEYARARLERDARFVAGGIDEHVRALRIRQGLLLDRAGRKPRVRVFAGMRMFSDLAVDADASRALLRRLAGLVGEPRGITLRVLHDGYAPTVPFTWLRLPDGRRVVYLATEVTETFLTRPGHLDRYRHVLTELAHHSLTEQDSHAYLAQWLLPTPADDYTTTPAAGRTSN